MVKALIDKGCTKEASKCIEAGYTLPDSLLMEAIREEKDALIWKIIEGKFYKVEKDQWTCKVEFWYLLSKGRLEMAKVMY